MTISIDDLAEMPGWLIAAPGEEHLPDGSLAWYVTEDGIAHHISSAPHPSVGGMAYWVDGEFDYCNNPFWLGDTLCEMADHNFAVCHFVMFDGDDADQIYYERVL